MNIGLNESQFSTHTKREKEWPIYNNMINIHDNDNRPTKIK